MPHWPSYSPTRYRHIGLSRLSPGLWRWVCLDWDGGGTTPRNPAAIGPCYCTKTEALADLERYAQDSYPELA
jgi:hypothetical protein